jgi:hypothetical protein
MDEMHVEAQLANADLEYLTAMVCPSGERGGHLAKAMAAYRECRHLSIYNLLRYYVDAGFVKAALPPGFGIERIGDHKPLEDLTLEQGEQVLQTATDLKTRSGNKYVNTDRLEFDRFIDHCTQREANIRQETDKAASQP